MVNFRSLSFGRAFFMSANVNTVVFFNGSQKLFMGFSPSHSLMNSSATVFPFSGMCHSEFSTFSGCIALGAQRPIVIKLSRVRSVGRSVCQSVGLFVCLSVQCIVEKRQIAAGSRSAPYVGRGHG